jgi:hypothetical protein
MVRVLLFTTARHRTIIKYETCALESSRPLLVPFFHSWVVDTYFSDSDLARLLQLGKYSPMWKDGVVIDVPAERTMTRFEGRESNDSNNP